MFKACSDSTQLYNLVPEFVKTGKVRSKAMSSQSHLGFPLRHRQPIGQIDVFGLSLN